MKWTKLIAWAISFLAAPFLLAQCTPPGESAMPNYNERALRGSVKSCTSSNTVPAVTDANGTIRPETSWGTTTEFDPAGRELVTRHDNPDRSAWVSRNTYDNSGRLLKTTSGDGKTDTETIYTYDSLRRLQQISSGDRPPIVYRYDEQGRKTQVATSRPEDYRPNMATGIEALAMPPNLPGGGTATTIYDDHDHSTEIQVRNDNHEIVNRVVRTYDEQGRLIEEKQVLDHPENMFPQEIMAQIQSASGQSVDEVRQQMRAEITKLMGGTTDSYVASYRYDKDGRLNRTSRRIFNQQEEIDTTYNEHGDVESEITHRSELKTDPANPTASLPSYSEVRHSYQYDAHDNWIEQTTSYRSSPDEAFQVSSTFKRTLTYY